MGNVRILNFQNDYHFIFDENISLKAKGLMLQLLALQQNEQCASNTWIARHSSDKRFSILNAIDELKEFNYLKIQKNGMEYIWFVDPNGKGEFEYDNI